jgi:hypothetical protein
VVRQGILPASAERLELQLHAEADLVYFTEWGRGDAATSEDSIRRFDALEVSTGKTIYSFIPSSEKVDSVEISRDRKWVSFGAGGKYRLIEMAQPERPVVETESRLITHELVRLGITEETVTVLNETNVMFYDRGTKGLVFHDVLRVGQSGDRWITMEYNDSKVRTYFENQIQWSSLKTSRHVLFQVPWEEKEWLLYPPQQDVVQFSPKLGKVFSIQDTATGFVVIEGQLENTLTCVKEGARVFTTWTGKTYRSRLTNAQGQTLVEVDSRIDCNTVRPEWTPSLEDAESELKHYWYSLVDENGSVLGQYYSTRLKGKPLQVNWNFYLTNAGYVIYDNELYFLK